MEIGEGVSIALIGGVAVTRPKPVPKFLMHFDADRDGKVDDDWRCGTWNWGRGKRGAICLCNNDSDDSRPSPDNADAKINGGNDKSEIAPIVIRKRGSAAVPGSWKGYLKVSAADARRIRVFDSRAAGGAEILGPGKGATYTFPSLSFTEKEFGLEALFYAGELGARDAGTNWDGRIEVIFSVEDGSTIISEQHGRMRVAPWMIPHHLEPADKVFVVDDGYNGTFRGELDKLVKAAGCSLEPPHPEVDPWMQDCMEIGYSFVPKHHMPVVMQAKRDRELQTFPKKLLKPDFGYEEPTPVPPGDSTFDSTGNLEVTPPVRSRAGKTYPWGRIYFGPGRGLPLEPVFDPDVASFLHAQGVQAPILIDTGWLAVGHVDEIMTFVPAPTGKGFKLLLASPRLAYKILERAVREKNGSAKMLTGRFFGAKSAEVSINDFLTKEIKDLSLTAVQFKTFNDTVGTKLAAIRKRLETDLSLTERDILEVPILFTRNHHQPRFFDALTAGMVNMLVLNKHCIVPKPFGPVVKGIDLFEENLKLKLEKLGLTVKFIDDWYDYHVHLGEVHCGTNTLRKPNPAKWKWWEFLP